MRFFLRVSAHLYEANVFIFASVKLLVSRIERVLTRRLYVRCVDIVEDWLPRGQ